MNSEAEQEVAGATAVDTEMREFYKPSSYNSVFETSTGEMLAYNAITGGLLKLNKQKLEIVNDMLNRSTPFWVNEQDDHEIYSIFRILEKGGFLVSSETDELQMIKTRTRQGRYSTRWLYLTILPTLNCNFGCPYCYEPDKAEDLERQTMADDVAQALEKFVIDQAKKVNLLHITWFGGEPLLNPRYVERLNTAFAKAYEDSDADFESHLVTNGYLLSAELARRLKDSFIQTVQITIDGPKKVHDGRRFLRGGGGTYERIMQNIYPAIETFGKLNVGIRVNVDRSNRDAFPELLSDLERRGLKEKVIIDIGHVECLSTDWSGACDTKSNCLSSPEFGEVLPELYREMRIRGFMFPTPRRPGISNCVAEVAGAFVVGPGGELYKCWREVGEAKNVVGQIDSDGEMTTNHRLYNWLSYEAFEDGQCLECKMLPVCMGGCKADSIKLGGPRKSKCPGFALNFERILEEFYHLRERHRPSSDNSGSKAP